MKEPSPAASFPGSHPTRTPPRPGSHLPPAPAHLSDEAQRLWCDLVAEFAITDSAGVAILTTALQSFDRMQNATEAITRDGVTSKDRFGQLRSHPLLTVERDSRAAWLAGLRLLNLDLEPLRDRPGRPPKG